MRTTIITGQWLTFKDLEQKLQIAGPTLRRWSEKFPNFLGAKKINRVLSFPASSLEVFKLIKQLFDDGNDTASVMAALTQEMAQTHDVTPIPKDDQAPTSAPAPALPDTLGQLLPVLDRLATSFERLVGNQERILEEMKLTREAIQAAQGPQDAPKASGDINPHPERETGQESPLVKVVVNRDAVIARVMELSAQGLGQHAIMTRIRREGLRMSPRGEISKSTVARIIKGDIK